MCKIFSMPRGLYLYCFINNVFNWKLVPSKYTHTFKKCYQKVTIYRILLVQGFLFGLFEHSHNVKTKAYIQNCGSTIKWRSAEAILLQK